MHRRMANPTIHKVLDPILKHHRQHRFKRRLSILFTSWGLLGLIAAWLAPLWNFSGDWLWKGFLLACSFLTFAVWLHHRRQIISLQDLARRIEEDESRAYLGNGPGTSGTRVRARLGGEAQEEGQDFRRHRFTATVRGRAVPIALRRMPDLRHSSAH